MYAKIKELADEAIALQNKNRMDEVLREISGMCGDAEADTLALIADQCERLAVGGNISVSNSRDDFSIVGAHNPDPLSFPGTAIAAAVEPAPVPAKSKKGGAK